MLKYKLFGSTFAVLCVFVICSYSYADDGADLQEKVRELQEENKRLRAKLIENNIPVEDNAPPAKSLASIAGVETKKPLVKNGFLDFNYYFTNQDSNRLTINALANIGDLQYFQFLNLDSAIDSGNGEKFDLNNYYTEIHLRYPIYKKQAILKALDWTVMYTDGTLAKDLVRLGARIRFKDLPGVIGDFFRNTLGLSYSMNLWPYESDGEGVQIEHVYRKDILDGLIYFSGFGDQEIDSTGVYWVTEHQTGLRVVDNVYLIHELQYVTNAPRGQKWTSLYGLQYVIPF